MDFAIHHSWQTNPSQLVKNYGLLINQPSGSYDNSIRNTRGWIWITRAYVSAFGLTPALVIQIHPLVLRIVWSTDPSGRLITLIHNNPQVTM